MSVLLKIFKKLINSIWVIPVVFLFRLLSLFFNFKFVFIPSERIGHFVLDTIYELILRNELKLKEKRIIFITKSTSNEFWKRFAKRNLKIINWAYDIYYWNEKIPGGKKLNHKYKKAPDEIPKILKESGIKLKFLDEEDMLAKKWLKEIGLSEGDPFVCVMIRDSSYLSKSAPNFDWTYNNYRDSHIDTYIRALEWLSDQGVWVFRMGKIMTSPLPSSNKKIIDYAFLKNKNDFLDIWLFANCKFCITTGSGPDIISDIFGKPLLYLNHLPLNAINYWSKATTIPKNLFWEENGQELSLKEQLSHSHLAWEQPDRLLMKDLTEKEILSYVKEFFNFIKTDFKMTEEDKILKDKFWNIIKSRDKNNFITKIHSHAGPSLEWLKKREDNFLL